MIIENDVEIRGEELCCTIPVIGGKCDGQQYLINREELYKNGFPKLVQIHEPQKLKSVSNYRNILSISNTVKIYNYKPEKFHMSKEEIYYYLIPENWSYKEAMKHQMRK